MCAYNFLVCGPKFTKFLTFNVEVVVVDHLIAFQIFVLSIYFGVICAQSRKLSLEPRRILDIFALPNFVGAPLPKLVPTLSRMPRASSPGKVSQGYSH